MNIIQKLLPIIPKGRRGGIKNTGIKYIVCHDTGNDGSTAANNVNYYHSQPGVSTIQTSAHYFLDDKEIIQIIPDDEKAWHVGYGTGVAPNIAPTFMNDCSLGIELCYGSSWGTLRNLASYSNYTGLIAELCTKYKLDPATALIGHYKVDPARRTDPINAFKVIGKNWTQFVEDVKAKITPVVIDPLTPIMVPASQLPKILAFFKTL